MICRCPAGWFFVVASEAHHASATPAWKLPGIGAYVAVALDQRRHRRRVLGDRRDARRHPAPMTSCCSGRWWPGPPGSASR
jgi:hypothetical protein